MKVLFVAPYFLPNKGGVENYVFNISKRLHENFKVKVVIVTSALKKNTFTVETLEGLKVYRIPTWFKISNTPINFMLPFYINKIIKEENPDIINSHTPVPYYADISGAISKYRKIPHILTYHNDLVKNESVINFFLKFYNNTFGNTLLKNSDLIITTSQYYAKKSPYLRNYLDKVKIVSPGIDINNTKIKLPKISVKGYVLFVGSLNKTHSHKGVDILLNAIKIVTKTLPNLKLVIIGSGDNQVSFEQLAKQLKIENSVIFMGEVSDSELYSYYHNASMVVLPSTNDSEGFGMVLIEAGLFAKPVIGTQVGGIPYVIDNESTGSLVKPRDVKSLAKTINNLLSNKSTQKKFGKNGYKKVLKNYDYSKLTKKYYEILNLV